MVAIDNELFPTRSGGDDSQSQHCWDTTLSLIGFEDFLRTSAGSTPPSFDGFVSSSTADWAGDTPSTCISSPATTFSKSASPSSASSTISSSQVSADHTVSDMPTTPFDLDAFTNVFDLPDHSPSCSCHQQILATLSTVQPPPPASPDDDATTISLDKLLCANKTILTAVRATLGCAGSPTHSTSLTILLYHLLHRVIGAYQEAWLSTLAFERSSSMTGGRAIAFGAYSLTDDDDGGGGGGGGARALVKQIVGYDLRRAGEVAEKLAERREGGDCEDGGGGGSGEILAFLRVDVMRELQRVTRQVEWG